SPADPQGAREDSDQPILPVVVRPGYLIRRHSLAEDIHAGLRHVAKDGGIAFWRHVVSLQDQVSGVDQRRRWRAGSGPPLGKYRSGCNTQYQSSGAGSAHEMSNESHWLAPWHSAVYVSPTQV